MSGETSPSDDIFDPHKIRRLIELMNEHELSEIDLKQGGTRIRLRKGFEPVYSHAPPPPVAAVQQAGKPSGGGATAAQADEEKLAVVKSPMVGTFFSAANPESAPFVKVGDRVNPESTVCIIEAMKVFNEIPAEVSGQIVATLVENGEPVEYGQPLFRVDAGK